MLVLCRINKIIFITERLMDNGLVIKNIRPILRPFHKVLYRSPSASAVVQMELNSFHTSQCPDISPKSLFYWLHGSPQCLIAVLQVLKLFLLSIK